MIKTNKIKVGNLFGGKLPRMGNFPPNGFWFFGAIYINLDEF